jgi:hypothetical protein
MTTDPITLLTVAGAMLGGVSILSFTALRGWTGWLDLQRTIGGGQRFAGGLEETSPAARIEMADLRERVRKLEAIAAGVDL